MDILVVAGIDLVADLLLDKRATALEDVEAGVEVLCWGRTLLCLCDGRMNWSKRYRCMRAQ